MSRVLVVGERPEEETSLAFRLSLLGHEATATAAVPALIKRSIETFAPEVIVLRARSQETRDVFEFVSSLSDAAIFVMAERYSESDLVHYLENGALDYISGVISPRTLSARLTARERWAERAEHGVVIEAGGVTIDFDRAEVLRDGHTLPLTRTELRVIEVLNRYRGRVCSHGKLLEEVWGPEFASCHHYVRIYIGYLRRKLEADPKSPQVIQTIWGLGYRLTADGRRAPNARRAPEPRKAEAKLALTELE